MADLMDATLQLNKQRQDSLDQWASLYDNAKVVDMAVKANPDLPQRMGFQSPEQFKSLSAQDKIAAFTGMIKNQGVEEFQTKQQEAAAKIAEYQSLIAQREAGAAADQDAGTFVTQYGKLLAENPDADPKEAFYQTLSAMPKGFQVNRALPKIMDSLQKWQAVTEKAEKPDPADLTPRVTLLPVGTPGTADYHEVPWISQGKVGQVDPSYAINERTKSATALETRRETARATLKPAELLKSYQSDLESLNKAWDLTPEDRATRRAELRAKIEKLRTSEGAPGKPPASSKYTSAEEVKAAYKAGKLDKAGAAKILQSQFGMQ